MHFASQYVGKKWKVGTYGPDFFDCWGLVVWIRHAHYGNSLMGYPVEPSIQRPALAKFMEASSHLSEWIRLQKPVDGCAVALSTHTLIHHVAIYFDVDGGLVLHSKPDSGVIAQKLSDLPKHGWNRIEFYSHRSWLTS